MVLNATFCRFSLALCDIMSYKICMDGELTPPSKHGEKDVKIKKFRFKIEIKFLGIKLKLEIRF